MTKTRGEVAFYGIKKRQRFAVFFYFEQVL
jgi:hypothetical protein